VSCPVRVVAPDQGEALERHGDGAAPAPWPVTISMR
jgi:hypothetical protein